jgi:hypothetical protein
VVDVVDVTFAPDGRPCIVTELLEGWDLERHTEACGGKLNVAQAIDLARQCLRALSAVHMHGIVHRDLKPSNLFLCRDASGRSTLKLLDFGIAKSSQEAELTASGVLLGTPAYMAPEQARGAHFADQRSDLYAVGAILYRLLTGRLPYDEPDANTTLLKLVQGPPPPPRSLEPSIPSELDAAIQRAMAHDPEQRYQQANEFDAALVRIESAHDTRSGGRISRAAARLRIPARHARPLTVLSGLTLSSVLGLACSALLGLLVDVFSQAPRLGDSALLGTALGGGASGLALLGLCGHAFLQAYDDRQEVARLGRRFTASLVAFVATLGALELGALVGATFLEARPGQLDPLYASARLLCALVVALMVLTRHR